ncbi:MAG: hypothetical protein ABI761_06555 [Saprospiraceae bacterium]
MKFWKHILGLDSDFKQVFYLNEFGALRGKNSRTLVILTVILFMTFLAFGWAIGGLKNLHDRTNDPFTNWISLSVTGDNVRDQAANIFDRYELNSVRDSMHIDTVSGWSHFWWSIHDVALEKEFNLGGLTVVPQSKLLAVILDPDLNHGNVQWIADDAEQKFMKGGLIITAETVSMLGYDNSPEKLSEVSNLLVNKDNRLLALPVIAVVNQLPSYCAFAVTPEIYNVLNGKIVQGVSCYQYIQLAKEGDTHFPFMIRGDDFDKNKLENKITHTFGEEVRLIQTDVIASGPVEWIKAKIAFSPSLTPPLAKVLGFFKEEGLYESLGVETGATVCKQSNFNDFHYIAFNFKDLNRMQEFRKDLKSKFGIPIDMRQAEDKENFALVSRLTSSILIVLLLFSALSIILFLSNLLKNHLNKVQQNLGTFKAFGLSTRFLTGTYSKIVFGMLSISIFVSLSVAVLLDLIEQRVMRDQSSFQIFSPWLVLAIVAILASSLIIVMRNATHILKNSPGDLIYNRTI